MKIQKKCENEYEKQAWANQQLVIGLDEAGRGPLCGPLVVAGVVFPIGYENEEIYDSKAISEKKRERLFETIQQDALHYWIEFVSPKVIDQKNIYRADQDCMFAIAQKANVDMVLTDAMPLSLDTQVISLIKGDQKSISIAAASILAKVARDRYMIELDQKYPMYGFAKNKGYGTKQHIQAIQQYGIIDEHRRSFAPVAYQQESLPL